MSFKSDETCKLINIINPEHTVVGGGWEEIHIETDIDNRVTSIISR